MEFYIFILVVLFCTALADLIVGVSNDAVNFLNSAIGSKAAPRITIMIIASLGVLVGTTFSSGIMEVARKGIFNPEYFVFEEVMIIFLAVMLTDILLLDLYNTFALPTSTTVSIVFEILGGAMALAVLKFSREGYSLLTYINSAKVLTIVSSIGLSIVFAFIFGFLLQFLTRFWFTFDYDKTFKRYGAIFCGICVSIITLFILIKGAKGSSFMTSETSNWIQSNIWLVLGGSFVIWFVISQILILFTKINVLKIVVLIGTFALALAFAANDLVNFIGAPLGALAAFKIGQASGGDPSMLSMAALAKPVQANTWILLIAGAVMVITLWLSRKARSVTKTEVNLGRQEEGIERFESSPLSRGIVRMGISLTDGLKKITPVALQNTVIKRIDPGKYKKEKADKDGDAPAFDLLRASVNLMVASALVSLGTSFKLPLSTTFVTFTVAMSTSLADKAWGRDSAVYRVNGMITVIGGWFFTAFLAFSSCFVLTMFIYFVKLPAIIILLVLGFYFYFRMTKIHKEREEEYEKKLRERQEEVESLDGLSVVIVDIGRLLDSVDNNLKACFKALIGEKRKHLKKTKEKSEELASEVDRIVNNIFQLLTNSDEDAELVSLYAQKIAALQIISSNQLSITERAYNHIDNNHHPLTIDQADELQDMGAALAKLITSINTKLSKTNFDDLSDLTKKLDDVKSAAKKFNKNQMKRIKSKKTGTKLSMIFINILTASERIGEQLVTLVKLLKQAKK